MWIFQRYHLAHLQQMAQFNKHNLSLMESHVKNRQKHYKLSNFHLLLLMILRNSGLLWPKGLSNSGSSNQSPLIHPLIWCNYLTSKLRSIIWLSHRVHPLVTDVFHLVVNLRYLLIYSSHKVQIRNGNTLVAHSTIKIWLS